MQSTTMDKLDVITMLQLPTANMNNISNAGFDLILLIGEIRFTS